MEKEQQKTMELDDGNILTGKPKQFHGKNNGFRLRFSLKPIHWKKQSITPPILWFMEPWRTWRLDSPCKTWKNPWLKRDKLHKNHHETIKKTIWLAKSCKHWGFLLAHMGISTIFFPWSILLWKKWDVWARQLQAPAANDLHKPLLQIFQVPIFDTHGPFLPSFYVPVYSRFKY